MTMPVQTVTPGPVCLARFLPDVAGKHGWWCEWCLVPSYYPDQSQLTCQPSRIGLSLALYSMGNSNYSNYVEYDNTGQNLNTAVSECYVLNNGSNPTHSQHGQYPILHLLLLFIPIQQNNSNTTHSLLLYQCDKLPSTVGNNGEKYSTKKICLGCNVTVLHI